MTYLIFFLKITGYYEEMYCQETSTEARSLVKSLVLSSRIVALEIEKSKGSLYFGSRTNRDIWIACERWEKGNNKGDFKFFNLMILMDGGVIYKRGETYGRNMLYFMYFIWLGVYGFEDIDRLYLRCYYTSKRRCLWHSGRSQEWWYRFEIQ